MDTIENLEHRIKELENELQKVKELKDLFYNKANRIEEKYNGLKNLVKSLIVVID